MKKLLMIGMALLFLSACSTVSISNDTSNIAIDGAASTIGYLIGKENPEKVSQWIDWGNKILEIKPGFPVNSFEKLLAIGMEISTDDKFLKMQFNKLIKLLDFPELQPPDLSFLQEKYIARVKLIIAGFLDGLYAV